jgi:hypothetical protein
MNKYIIILLGFAVLLILLIAAVGISCFRDVDKANSQRTISVAAEIAEDVAVSRHGIYGVDFVRCGRVKMEKMKKGPFALGAFNKLVLDDLRVVLPCKPKKVDEGISKDDEAIKSSAKNMLKNIGVDTDFLMANGVNRKFSGLQINGLKICRLDSMTNILEVLQAKKAELKLSVGLELIDVEIIEQGVTRSVSKAYLKNKNGTLKITWSEGEIDLL